MNDSKIFLIDENPTFRRETKRAISAALQRTGLIFIIAEFNSVDEAAACLDDEGAPALVLCDRDSDELNAAFVFYRHLREVASDTWFIVWTPSPRLSDLPPSRFFEDPRATRAVKGRTDALAAVIDYIVKAMLS